MLGLNDGSLLLVEAGIALSVVLLGGLLIRQADFPLIAVAIAVGSIGFFHGHAHGTEMPTFAIPAYYFCGFLMATAALHALGILSGKYFTQSEKGAKVLRLAGVAVSCLGLALLLR